MAILVVLPPLGFLWHFGYHIAGPQYFYYDIQALRWLIAILMSYVVFGTTTGRPA